MIEDGIKETPIFKDLTIKDLRKSAVNKEFFTKEGTGAIFPVDTNKYGLIITEIHDGSDDVPIYDEFSTIKALTLLGADGWVKNKVV